MPGSCFTVEGGVRVHIIRQATQFSGYNPAISLMFQFRERFNSLSQANGKDAEVTENAVVDSILSSLLQVNAYPTRTFKIQILNPDVRCVF